MGLFSFISKPIKSVLGDFTGSNTAEKQIDSSQKLASAKYKESKSMFQPYTEGGLASYNLLKDYYQQPYGGLTDGGLLQLEDATKAYNRNMASRGLLGSGGAASGLADLERRIRAADYDNWLNRYLSGNAALVDTGMSGLNSIFANNNNYVNTMSNLNAQKGQLATSYSPFNVGMSALGGIAGLYGVGALGDGGRTINGPLVIR